jgi:hypothetical protein
MVPGSRHELRLIERVPQRLLKPVLRVELLDLQTRTVIESRGCEEVEDAVAAFQAMFPNCPSQKVNRAAH